MKKIYLFFAALLFLSIGFAQSYPTAPNTKEIYLLKKGTKDSLVSLEKQQSKFQTKTKMGGFGGMETGYALTGSASPVRLTGTGAQTSFIFSLEKKQYSKTDSLLRANGIEPDDYDGNEMEPANDIVLYKLDASGGRRKIGVMKSSGGIGFGMGKAKKSDNRLPFGTLKIRPGYWELVIDQRLAKGEYAFAFASSAESDETLTVFAFGVD